MARRRRSRPEDRRREILEAAVEVFGRQGYRKGSLKEVAAAVGLSQQGVLHHFSSKEELLRAVLEQRNVARARQMKAIERDEGVVAVVRFILRQNVERPGFQRLYVTLAAEATDAEHPAHAYFLERYRTTHEKWRAVAERDMSLGRLRAGLDSGQVATELIALSDGLQLQALLRPDLDVLAAFDAATRAWALPAA